MCILYFFTSEKLNTLKKTFLIAYLMKNKFLLKERRIVRDKVRILNKEGSSVS